MMYLPIAIMLLFAALPLFGDYGDREDDDPDREPNPDTLRGSDGDDILTAGEDTALIEGLGGDDTITSDANFLEIRIDAGDGDDTVTTGGGASVSGGNGNDTITTLAFSTIDGGAGDDIIAGVEESLILGGDGNDVISGSTFGSTVDGGAGDDVIDADVASIITTGTGNDEVNIRLDLAFAGDTWNAGPVTVTDYVAGQDTFFLNNNILPATPEGDPASVGTREFIEDDDGVTVTVNGFGFVRLQGVTLDDIDPEDFVLDPESLTLTGTEGADTLTAGASTGLIQGLGGNDTITSSFEFLPVTVDAGDGNDTVTIGLGGTVLGGNGDDTIRTRQDSVVDGGAGDDTIFVADGTTITGGTGTDTLNIAVESTSTFDFPIPTVTDYATGQDIYQLRGTVTDGEGNPIGTGALDFVEDEDGVRVIVDGRNVVRLEGVTLDDIDPDDFVLDAQGSTLTGTAGADTLTADEDTVRIEGLGGNDTIFSLVEDLTNDGRCGRRE
jgi:Ca2+-binding RTX toxin-like protein